MHAVEKYCWLKHHQPKAFTLLELLTVISILSILMVSLVSLTTGSVDARRLNAAADLVAGLANQARQNSLSRSALTALVVLGKDAPEGKGLNSLALFELQKPDQGALATSSEWKQVTAWKQFPTGVVIDETSIDSTFFKTGNLAPSPPLPASVKVSGQSTGDFAYQVFQPNGRLMNPATVTLKVMPNTGGTSSAANYVVISIISSTGQTKIFQP